MTCENSHSHCPEKSKPSPPLLSTGSRGWSLGLSRWAWLPGGHPFILPALLTLCVSCLAPGDISQVALVIKNLPANAGDLRDAGSTPRSGRSSGGEHGNPLRTLAWRISGTEEPGGATVHGVAKSRTRPKPPNRHTHRLSRSPQMKPASSSATRIPADLQLRSRRPLSFLV